MRPPSFVLGIPLSPEIWRLFRHILRRHHRGEASTWDRDKQGSPRNYAHGGISISSGSRGQWLRQTHRNICWLLANWPTVRRNRVLVKWPRTVIQIRAGEVTINLGRKVDQDYNALHARTESWRPRSECPHIGFGKAVSSVRGGLDSPASAVDLETGRKIAEHGRNHNN